MQATDCLHIVNIERLRLLRQFIFFFFFSGMMVAVDSSTLVPGIMTFGDSSVDVGNNNHLKQARFSAIRREHQQFIFFSSSFSFFFLFSGMMVAVDSSTLVPGIMTFGDSSVDVGNNNHLKQARFKANYWPYGRDFSSTPHSPSGRFSNGKIASDFTAEKLGFKKSPEAYLSKSYTRQSLPLGANFASAGSGYYNMTSLRYNAIPLSKQLDYFKDYSSKLVKFVGKKKAISILTESLYVISTGDGDFLQNYYINPSLRDKFSVDQFTSLLIDSFSSFVKHLYSQGARVVAVTSLPPMGCLPAAINHYGGNNYTGCIGKMNRDALGFNTMLRKRISLLRKELRGMRIAMMNIYTPLMELSKNPTKHGFVEGKKGCCGTGTSEATVLCKSNMPAVMICSDARKWVFWDGVHPSEAANKFISDAILLDGISLMF